MSYIYFCRNRHIVEDSLSRPCPCLCRQCGGKLFGPISKHAAFAEMKRIRQREEMSDLSWEDSPWNLERRKPEPKERILTDVIVREVNKQ